MRYCFQFQCHQRAAHSPGVPCMQTRGPLKVTGSGLTWRAVTGGKTIEIKKDGEHLSLWLVFSLASTSIGHADIEGLYWTKNPRVCQLGVRVRDGPTTNFLGFQEKVWPCRTCMHACHTRSQCDTHKTSTRGSCLRHLIDRTSRVCGTSPRSSWSKTSRWEPAGHSSTCMLSQPMQAAPQVGNGRCPRA